MITAPCTKIFGEIFRVSGSHYFFEFESHEIFHIKAISKDRLGNCCLIFFFLLQTLKKICLTSTYLLLKYIQEAILIILHFTTDIQLCLKNYILKNWRIIEHDPRLILTSSTTPHPLGGKVENCIKTDCKRVTMQIRYSLFFLYPSSLC